MYEDEKEGTHTRNEGEGDDEFCNEKYTHLLMQTAFTMLQKAVKGLLLTPSPPLLLTILRSTLVIFFISFGF